MLDFNPIFIEQVLFRDKAYLQANNKVKKLFTFFRSVCGEIWKNLVKMIYVQNFRE